MQTQTTPAPSVDSSVSRLNRTQTAPITPQQLPACWGHQRTVTTLKTINGKLLCIMLAACLGTAQPCTGTHSRPCSWTTSAQCDIKNSPAGCARRPFLHSSLCTEQHGTGGYIHAHLVQSPIANKSVHRQRRLHKSLRRP